ncbi:MAG: PilZ domain-containing protein [Candidatus Acidiferrales bacterium]|jgi:hypothetical protein
MISTTYSIGRRSSRMFHSMPLLAAGKTRDGRRFRETCETIVISAHGALICLQHEVTLGAILVLANPETMEEQECRVMYLGEMGEQGQRVGVEFLTPAPRFWGVDFEALRIAGWSPADTVH